MSAIAEEAAGPRQAYRVALGQEEVQRLVGDTVFLVVAIGVSSAAVVLMTMAGVRDEPAEATADAAA